MVEKITINDVEEYAHLFSLAPSFILERMAKKNSNIVHKFQSSIQSYIDSLTDEQRNKFEILLNSDIAELQALMHEAHRITNKKQYKILANPQHRDFIEKNLAELRKMI